MTPQVVAERIAAEFSALPDRMQRVGTYILDHPEDVALLSMREQARRAGVPPAAMTRFAQRFGYTGYDELRGLFAESMRGKLSDFGARAGALAAERERLGEPTLALSIAGAMIDRVAALSETARVEAIVAGAAVLSQARRVYCLGHRSCYAPAYHFAYIAGLYGAPTHLLDAPGGISGDGLNAATAEDALLAISFAPYTRATVEIAESATAAGVSLVALTDSRASPLARHAATVITVPTEISAAAYVTSPAFAAAELLAALVVAQSGPEGRAVLDRNESTFARHRVYWEPRLRRVS